MKALKAIFQYAADQNPVIGQNKGIGVCSKKGLMLPVAEPALQNRKAALLTTFLVIKLPEHC